MDEATYKTLCKLNSGLARILRAEDRKRAKAGKSAKPASNGVAVAKSIPLTARFPVEN